MFLYLIRLGLQPPVGRLTGLRPKFPAYRGRIDGELLMLGAEPGETPTSLIRTHYNLKVFSV